MKTIITFLTLLISIISTGQIVEIPDYNFKLILRGAPCADLDGDGVIDGDVDINNDGEIQNSEAEMVKGLYMSGMVTYPIHTLTGIESFTNLEVLEIQSHPLTTLDFSNNLFLKELDCSIVPLTDINLSQNINLEYLHAWRTDLTEINITNCPVLNYLHIGQTDITEIDISQNPLLETFVIALTPIEDLNLSQNPNLRTIYLDYSNVTGEIDLSHAHSLERFIAPGIKLSALSLKNGNIEAIEYVDVYDNPFLDCIEVDDVDIANNKPLWRKDEDAYYSENCSLGLSALQDQNLILYPNPTKNILFVKSSGKVNSIKVHNLQGLLVMESDNGNDLNVSSLPPGMYIAQIVEDFKSSSLKFIKM